MEIHKTQPLVNKFQIPHTHQEKSSCQSSYLNILKTVCVDKYSKIM